LFPLFQACMPQHGISRFAGWLANSKKVWLKNYLIRYFVNRYPVKMNEAIISNPFAYKSYNEFFTRALKPEVRPISSGLFDFVSPADGTLSAFGHIDEGQLIQAKGRNFSVIDLLGGDTNLASVFKDGSFLTVYLAPQDYHRVHIPMDGHLSEMIYVPGSLFSVNQETAEGIPNLFARNERIVTIFNTSRGRVAIILIGAMIVGSMETVWAGQVAPNKTPGVKNYSYNNSIFLRRGEELGRFKLGSTVIILTEANVLNFDLDLKLGNAILMGQRLGTFMPDRL
jgi:phosphatidylserine decarboxylase